LDVSLLLVLCVVR